jgi:hypothetical protein
VPSLQNSNMANRIDHAMLVHRILPAIALGIALLASGRVSAYEGAIHIPSAYDHPFTGRMIVEEEALSDVLDDDRCQHTWNVGLGPVEACSWHFDDPLNPGAQACHVVQPKLEDGVWTSTQAADALRIEMADCNGWHDTEENE